MPDILDLLADGATERAYLRTIPGPQQPPTLAQVWRDSAHAGRFLLARTGPGAAVGMLLSTSAECVATLVGGWRAGLRVASLPLPARATPMPEYLAQLQAAAGLLDVRLLVADEELAPRLTELPIPVATYPQALGGGPAAPVEQVGSFVQFTSGSTSVPKGVALTMAAIGENVLAMAARTGVPDPMVGCSWLPLSHDMGLVGMCLGIWACQREASSGGLVLIRPERFLRRPGSWLSACSTFGATLVTTPNFGLEFALRDLAAAGPLDLSRLAVCIVGAEPVRAETLRRFGTALAPSGFDPRALCPAYGMAEASLGISIKAPGTAWTSRHVDSAALEQGRWVERSGGDGADEVVALGPPLPGMQVTVDRSTPEQVGELKIRGPSMFDGYLGDPGPSTADGWFRTRDLGTLSAGEICLTGRTDDVMIIAGRNLYAPDLEEAAVVEGIRRHNTAAVSYGSGGYAIVVERPRGVKARDDMRPLCRRVRLAVAKRVGIGPAAVFVIGPGTFPRTPSGKPQRKRLANQLAADRLDIEAVMHFG